jgi:hypothetical protein
MRRGPVVPYLKPFENRHFDIRLRRQRAPGRQTHHAAANDDYSLLCHGIRPP